MGNKDIYFIISEYTLQDIIHDSLIVSLISNFWNKNHVVINIDKNPCSVNISLVHLLDQSNSLAWVATMDKLRCYPMHFIRIHRTLKRSDNTFDSTEHHCNRNIGLLPGWMNIWHIRIRIHASHSSAYSNRFGVTWWTNSTILDELARTAQTVPIVRGWFVNRVWSRWFSK